MTIQQGGHLTQEYREPRILRFFLTVFQNESVSIGFIKLPALPDLHFLNRFGLNHIYSESVHQIYKKLCKAFIVDRQKRKLNPELQIMAAGSGAVSYKTFNKLYSKEIKNLLDSSTTITRKIRGGLKVIYPKIPELAAYHSIKLITNKIDTISKKENSTSSVLNELLNFVELLPYSDIVATGVISNLAESGKIDLSINLINELLELPPKKELINAGTRAMMYDVNHGHVNLNFQDDFDDGSFTSNFLPYAILSQLVGHLMPVIKDNNNPDDVFGYQLYLISYIASNKNLLKRADATSLKNIKPHELYEWDEVGTLVSGKEGIVEPIVQSINKFFANYPKQIERLFDIAFDNDNVNLLWRIHLAIRDYENHSNKELSTIALDFKKRFRTFIHDFIKNNIITFESQKDQDIFLENED